MACIAKRRGRYIIDFYDNKGARRWVTLPRGSTKKKALDSLREIEDQLRRGVYLPAKKIPTFEEVAKDWMEHKKHTLRETTWEIYGSHMRTHLTGFNPIAVNRISTAMVEKFISSKLSEGMHINTLRKTLVILGQIMAYAVRHGYKENNPVRDAERPRDNRKDEKIAKILPPEDIRAFLEEVEGQKYKTFFLMSIMTGARQGELIGLKWTDIDFEKAQVHIQRTFTKGRFFTTKTEQSNRRVDLGPTVLMELKKWKLACPRNRLDLVFPNEVGDPMNYSNMMQRYFLPALKKAGLPRIRFHDLRHINASLRIEQSENIKYIQSQLGHSSPMVTLNVYAHLMKDTNQEAACRLEEAVLKRTGSKMVANSGSDNEKRVEETSPTL